MSVPVLPHRRDLRRGDFVFPEEILRIGHKLDFQFDCVSEQIQREVFGPELDTGKLGDWLNLYAAYDFALQDVVSPSAGTTARRSTRSPIPSAGQSGTSCAGRWRRPASSAPAVPWRGSTSICWQRRAASHRSSRLVNAAFLWTR